MRPGQVAFFAECLRRLEVKPEEAVYIGNDTFRDIKGAKDAGMTGILIMTKYGKKDPEVAAPDFTIGHIDEIKDVLKELKKR